MTPCQFLRGLSWMASDVLNLLWPTQAVDVARGRDYDAAVKKAGLFFGPIDPSRTPRPADNHRGVLGEGPSDSAIHRAPEGQPTSTDLIEAARIVEAHADGQVLRRQINPHEHGPLLSMAARLEFAAVETFLRRVRRWCVMGAKPEDERWAKFVTEGAPDECWEWRGALSGQGYGNFNLGGQQMRASRASLIRAGIHIPPGKCALHHCDNPPCVNPAHLYVGDRKQNALDCSRRKRHNKSGRGERHWASQYSDVEQQSWRVRAEAGESYRSIARATGASPSHISRVVRGIYRKVQSDAA